MSTLRSFATDVSQEMPDTNVHGAGDFITIIEMLIPVIVPLIERCFENREASEATFGAKTKDLAANANWRERIAFRIGLRREMGWQDYREAGGRQLANAFVQAASKAEVTTLDAVHAEACSC